MRLWIATFAVAVAASMATKFVWNTGVLELQLPLFKAKSQLSV
jgi:hypothetical protein